MAMIGQKLVFSIINNRFPRGMLMYDRHIAHAHGLKIHSERKNYSYGKHTLQLTKTITLKEKRVIL